MPTERMTVEVVVCGGCGSLEVHPSGLCAKCGYCLGSGDRETAFVPPDSLTAARLRLADAWLAHEDASAENLAAIDAIDPDGDQGAQLTRLTAAYDRCNVTRDALAAAAAALRTARAEG